MTRSNVTWAGTVVAAALAAATGFAGLATAAAAIPPAGPSAAGTQRLPGATPGPTAPADRDAQRIAELARKLQITPQQAPLWNDVAKVMRDNDERMEALTSARHAQAATVTAVEDLRSYEAITEAHAAGLKAFIGPFEKLYDNMSAAQKANADSVFRTTGHVARQQQSP